MRKIKQLAVLTVTTMMMTLAVPTVNPTDMTVAAVKAEETATVKEGRCGDNATYSYNPKTRILTISGKGDMWDDIRFADIIGVGGAAKIIIEKGITSIGSSSFSHLYGAGVEIADTVKTIKSDAFDIIGGTLTIPASVTKVESEALIFANKIVIKGNMENYQYAAFGVGADEIQIGGTADMLGYALAGVPEGDKSSITISKNNTRCKISNGCLMSTDGKTVYYYVSDREKVTIPDTVFTIKPAAFFQKDIKEITLGKNVKTIGEYAFLKSHITKIITNTNLKNIKKYAFARTKLKEVTLKSSVAMAPRAFDSKVKIYTTKGFKNTRTALSRATFEKKKIHVEFCKVAGAKGYQVQIKKGNKKYKYMSLKNDIRIKTPKAFKNTYNVKYNYYFDFYNGSVDGKPAYVTVRPYKMLKNKKKTYGKWSNKMILSR